MNYANLSDVEFEYLCKDVMSRKLSKNLQRFAPGRDGGIDLTDDAYARNTIVQVKHYVKTDVSGLMRSLQKEVAKVDAAKPTQYYVCCSKPLTPNNKAEIYDLFSPYMVSTENIVTAFELDDFLTSPENVDILRKHFKLWLDSTNILSDILTNDIFVDTEALLSNIEEEVKLFVKTQAFEEAISCLEKRNVLIIVGNPGVGKTVVSKMIVLHYAAQEYRVRYTTDGSDLKSLKRALSQSPNAKEVILLDDCFGQAYFKMKETQENELLALIKHVNICPNKLLIMNSRISIFQEAKERTQNLVNSFDHKEYLAYVLDMEKTSIEEKAKIFYNHLYFCGVPTDHFEDIRKTGAYRCIVKHRNYNPRIVEFVCNPRQFGSVAPDQYANFVMNCLDNPEQIWKNEFERRLAVPDRILLTTLFSLTDTTVPLDMLKACFEYRISRMTSLDCSINHFEQTLNRLADTMIKIIDKRGKKIISVSNPSVNDFLREHLATNIPERQSIIANCNCVCQLKKLLDPESYRVHVAKWFADQTILSCVFENAQQKNAFITAWCALNGVCDRLYDSCITEYIFVMQDVDMYHGEQTTVSSILDGLFQEKMFTFYNMKRIFCNICSFNYVIKILKLEDAVDMINRVYSMIPIEERVVYINTAQTVLRDKIKSYSIAPACFCDVNVSDIIENCMYEDGDCRGRIDVDAAIALLEETIKDSLAEELHEILISLPTDINPNNILYTETDFTVQGAESMVMSYLRDDYDDVYRAYREEQSMEDHVLDYIFNRKIQITQEFDNKCVIH